MSHLMIIVDLNEMDYDGSQLKHCLAYEYRAVLGPSICFFIGTADVKKHLVDLEDSFAGDFIKSERMAHFIIEIPNIGIQEAVVWQRLFIRMIAREIGKDTENLEIEINGDDIMLAGDKLSVSIATLSRFSGLIHVGINIHAGKDCPVPAIGLADITNGFGIFTDEHAWTQYIAHIFADEYTDIVNATYKVIER